MTSVLIADDHALVRNRLRHFLRGASGFEVVGDADDGATTIALVRSTDAHVLVPDLLYQPVKKGRMSVRAEALVRFWARPFAKRVGPASGTPTCQRNCSQRPAGFDTI